MTESARSICLNHKSVETEVSIIRGDQEKQWLAINSINEKLTRVQVNIAMIVGGIAVLQFVAVMIFK